MSIHQSLIEFQSMKTALIFKKTKAKLELAKRTRKDIAKLKIIAARISKIVRLMKNERKRSTV